MAYTTINKSTDYFNTKLYTGNGGTNAITGVGFAPDLTWIKVRNATQNHYWYDKVRGVQEKISSNNTGAQVDMGTAGLNTFGTDGFTVGNDTDQNNNGDTYASWNWKAGTTGSGSTSGSGTYKAYSYSVNTTAGFSIVKYVGNGTAGHTIPHHLGATPDTIIVKRLSATNNWSVYHKDSFVSQSDPGVLYLNTTAGKASDVNVWGNSSVTINSTVFSLGDYEGTNYNDSDYIAYCFTEKTGYSKFGKYTGNANADGTFVYTGFKPNFLLIKCISDTDHWILADNKRPGFNDNYDLYPNLNNAEYTGTAYQTDILSNGFKLRSTDAISNGSQTYIYMAFGQTLVGSNNIPCTAR